MQVNFVIWLHIENVHNAKCSAKKVSTSGVNNTLSLPVNLKV